MVKSIPELVEKLPEYLVFGHDTRLIDIFISERPKMPKFKSNEIDAKNASIINAVRRSEWEVNTQKKGDWLKANMPYSYDSYKMPELDEEMNLWLRDNISCWSIMAKMNNDYYSSFSFINTFHFIDENEMIMFIMMVE